MPLVPMEMVGVSMAPWLCRGDILLVDVGVSANELKPGDVVVVQPDGQELPLVHRVVRKEGLAIQTKGDRNADLDPPWFPQHLVGRVTQRHRGGRWKTLSGGKLLLWISLGRFYPGQRIPAWFSRSNVKRRLGF